MGGLAKEENLENGRMLVSLVQLEMEGGTGKMILKVISNDGKRSELANQVS